MKKVNDFLWGRKFLFFYIMINCMFSLFFYIKKVILILKFVERKKRLLFIVKVFKFVIKINFVYFVI